MERENERYGKDGNGKSRNRRNGKKYKEGKNGRAFQENRENRESRGRRTHTAGLALRRAGAAAALAAVLSLAAGFSSPFSAFAETEGAADSLSAAVQAEPGSEAAAGTAGYSWVQDGSGWRYADSQGQNISPGWQMIGGKWYWFGEDGWMKTGWLSQDGAWYYLEPSGAMASGWRQIDGAGYYFREDGVMQTGHMTQGETVYTFGTDGRVEAARKKKNTGGGSFEIGFYDEACQNLASNLNEMKLDSFDGDEDEDYYEDEKRDYDRDASYIVSGKLTEIAAHRLSMAREKGYGGGKIPGEGELSDYLKAIGYNSGRRSMEVYIRNADGAGEAEEKILDLQDDAKKRKDRPDYYSEMGIAHTEVNGRDYYMVIFMK